ncbi:phosphatidylinositol-glycan biosynthesis class X protein-like [Liolophura sinensis]|uniref:phosphatidylinositol-glycan biosynthesis class X protein-like n=1 Tax=Liolophura sinensis TaxID=3198878 RepID=UPI0031590366
MEAVFFREESLSKFVVVVLIWTCILTGIPAGHSEITTKVTRQLLKSGFHRDLHTEVTVEFTSGLMKNCKLMLAESLPASSYIDIYQIRQLSELVDLEYVTLDSTVSPVSLSTH